MSGAMSPHLYDLLDVEPSASDEEIRAAWKSAIAELDPTDRRFRAYNQAAEVLLDPTRRAAYDAELAAAEPDPEPEPVVLATGSAADPHPSVVTEVAAVPEAGTTSEPSAAGSGRTVPTWLLLALALLTVALLATTAYVWSRPSDTAVENATRSAQTAAEAAATTILSYDAATLDQDQKAAQAVMTSDYRKDYDQLFEVIKENAPRTETKVEADVIASGIVRSGEDRVSVLVFVNRPTTNKQNPQPVIYKDQVTVTMELVGDDWLVDDMETSPVAK